MNEKKKRKKYSNFCNSKSFLRSTTQYNICFSNDSNNAWWIRTSFSILPLFLDDDQTSNQPRVRENKKHDSRLMFSSNVESSRSQTTDEKLVDVEVDDAFPPWKSTECIPTRFVCRVISNPLCFFPPPTPVDQIRPLSEDIHHPRSSLFSNSKRAASNEICSFEQRRIHPFFSPPPSRF